MESSKKGDKGALAGLEPVPQGSGQTIVPDPNPGPTPSTTIGSTIVVRGHLTSEEDLVVCGRIEATISSSRDLRLEPGGVLLADVDVRSARIAGAVVGNIRASEVIELTPTARVVGDIVAPRLVVADGAQIDGSVTMEGLEELQHLLPTRTRSPAMQPTKAPAGRVPSKRSPSPVVTPLPLDGRRLSEDEPTAELEIPDLASPGPGSRFEPKTEIDEETKALPVKKRGWFNFG